MNESETFASLRLRGKSSSMRFGIMCNGLVFQQWQADAIRELTNHGHQPALLIMDGRPVHTTSLSRRILNKKRDTMLFTFLDNRMFKPGAKRPVDLHKDLQNIETLTCHIEQKGYSEYFLDSDTEAIRKYRLDFILRFGFNIIRGDILSVARFGVWSFHHDDEMIYRGGPPGFWEIFNGDPVSGAIMQRLTGKLDGGVILKKGYLKTVLHSYRGNLNQLLTVSSSWPAQVADALSGSPDEDRNTAILITQQASCTAAPLYVVPGNRQMIKFLFLLLCNRIKFYYRDMVTAEIWNVGVVRKPIREIVFGNEKLRETDINWLQEVYHSGYLADPAGFMEDGKLHILAEDYSYATQKAGISEIIWDPDNAGVHHAVRVIDGDNHLSYPSLVECQGELYCLPESYQSNCITLYQRNPVTGKFEKDRTLLDNVEGVDPTLFFYNGLWWLFFTDRNYSNTHLFLYYSKALTGEFIPHRLNPVKTDIRSARPAGTPFIHDNILYRPAQDCSVTYGGRVAINRLLRLTPDDFTEETVRFIEPVKGSIYGQGLHTISGVGILTLIDGKRYKLNLRFFKHQLRKKLNRKDSGNV